MASNTVGESSLEASTTGDWGVDNRIGRDRADALIDHMLKADAPFSLGHVVRDAIEFGAFTGVHVGFFHRIAERLR